MAHRFPPSLGAALAIVLATVAAVSGCTTGSRTAATLPATAIRDDTIQFPTDRAPVLAPGAECTAFTPRMRAAADIPAHAAATPMEPGHGCWTTSGDAVAILTTATPFGDFWRRSYPYDDGSGLTAMTVDKSGAQLFERFILDSRYYAVRVGSQWRAGLDSGVTKTACMLAVDTGSTKPLLITLTQQLRAGDPAVKTVAQQCTLATTVAHTVLDERVPGGGSRFR
jgi:hypothetical protein